MESMYPYPDVNQFYHSIGSPLPPLSVSEKAFDYDQAPLLHLAKRRLGATPADQYGLIDYALDLKYVLPLQKDLMLHCLPLCLETWQYCLIHKAESRFVEEFHSALAAKPNVIRETAGDDVSQLFFCFMKDSILASMNGKKYLFHEGQGAYSHIWIRHFASLGTFCNKIETIISEWKKLDTVGLAICFLKYLSVLIYEENNNPVFMPWTPKDGGGSPCLWEYDSTGFGERWSNRNIESLKRFLEWEELMRCSEALLNIMQNHKNYPIAQQVILDLKKNKNKIESRTGDLCEYLSLPSESGLWEWRS